MSATGSRLIPRRDGAPGLLGWGQVTRAELAWLLGCALLFWALKGTGKLLEGIPGHAAAFWVPVLFLARAGVPRPGAGACTGPLGGARWGLPTGKSLGLAGYVAAGLALDAFALRGDRLRWLPLALLAGVLCSLAKFSFHNIPAAVLGAHASFLAWGMAPVAGLHNFFGMAGGLIGWALVRKFPGSRYPDAGPPHN